MAWTIKSESRATACDHCKRPMYRAITFSIENEEGEQKQVGRVCLKFYIQSRIPAVQRNYENRASITARELAEEIHYQDMMGDPYATLSHAMCYLWKQYEEESYYQDSLLILETAREKLR